MKILFVPIFVLIACSLDGQNFPTFEDTPIWEVSIYDAFGSSKASVTVGPAIDTCGRNWYPIQETPSDEYQISQIIGYYYQQDAKVYYKGSLDCEATTYLMYDFSLELGDSVYIGIPYSYYPGFPDLDSVAYVAEKVEYKEFQGQLRKVIHLTFVHGTEEQGFAWHSNQWIEGVGALDHPFPSSICLPSSLGCEAAFSLECLQTFEGLVYASETSNCAEPQSGFSIIYVNHMNAQAPLQDGRSWETAFVTVQEALEIAEYGDSIWVARGTYFPTGGTDRALSFNLKNGVRVFGGFIGTESNLIERNWRGNPTVLSGNIGDTLNITDNSYHVLYGIGLDSTTVLDGFIIEDGHAFSSSVSSGAVVNGGGFLIDTNQDHNISVPQIKNCLFRNNLARNGGAVYCNGSQEQFTSPYFFNCIFLQNRGEGQGGAIFREGQSPDAVALQFIDCDFEENWARSSGAGVGLFDPSGEIIFQGCTFRRGTTISGSAGINIETLSAGMSLVIEDCHFESNQGSEGGALNIIQSNFTQPSAKNTIRISHSNFIQNEGKFSCGGAISIVSSSIVSELTIDRSNFLGNFSSGRGGAINSLSTSGASGKIDINSSVFKQNFAVLDQGGGAINVEGSQFDEGYKESSLSVFNSLFHQNQGIITIGQGSSGVAAAKFLNCTFYNNQDFPFAKAFSEMVSVDSSYSEIKLANSIIWEPSVEFSNLFVNGSPEVNTLYGYHFEHCLISSEGCQLPGGETACGDNNIFGLDPEFIDPTNSNFALHGCSPAINQGNRNLLGEFPADYDLAMQDRIQEDKIDMGAFEQLSANIMIEGLDMTAPSCYGSSDGAVTAIVEDSDTLHYSWQSGGNNGEGNMGLASGIYQFTIADENSCQGNFIVSIEAPDSLRANYSLVHPEDNINGALELIEISGGTPPYDYTWNTGETIASITGLVAGTYELTISDQNDCSKSYDFTLNNITSTEEHFVENNIDLYPNPVRLSYPLWLEYGLLEVNLFLITMTDIEGKVKRSKSFKLRPSERLDLSSWITHAGTYIFEVLVNNKSIKTIKVLAY